MGMVVQGCKHCVQLKQMTHSNNYGDEDVMSDTDTILAGGEEDSENMKTCED